MLKREIFFFLFRMMQIIYRAVKIRVKKELCHEWLLFLSFYFYFSRDKIARYRVNRNLLTKAEFL